MKAAEFAEQLVQLISNIDTAINTTCHALFEKGNGHLSDNDAYGKVKIVEFNEVTPIFLVRYKFIIGVAVQGSRLYVYIRDTDRSGRGSDPYSNCDYLLPFDECNGLTPHKLVEVLAALEKMA